MNPLNAEQVDPPLTAIKCIECNEFKFDFNRDSVIKNKCDSCFDSSFKVRLEEFNIKISNERENCDVCLTAFLSNLPCSKHDCTRVNIFCCSECGKVFRSKKGIFKHFYKRIIHRMECNICKKVFCERYSLKLHDCELSERENKSLNNELSDNIISKNSEIDNCKKKKFVCNYCQKSFAQRKHLTAHLNIHTKKKKFICNYCQKSFAQKSNLTVHLNVHTKGNKFICNYCQKSFIRKNNLIAHLNIHINENKFICNYCQKSFNRNDNFQMHLNIHTNENKFICEYCHNSFNYKRCLIRHLNIHTNEKKFICNYCQKSFTQKSNLMVHLKVHTEEKKFICNVCQKSFNRKSNLMVHLNIHLK